MLKYLFSIIFVTLCFSPCHAQNQTATVTSILKKAKEAVQSSVHSNAHTINNDHNHAHNHSTHNKNESGHEHCDNRTHFSVHGDLIFNTSKTDGGENESSMEMREVELELQHKFSENLKTDIFVGVEKENKEYKIHLEEAYLTFNSTGDSIRAKAGQILLPFGKVNQMHQHALPYADRPLVTESFLGEDGLRGLGALVQGKVSLSNKTDIKLTAAAVKGIKLHSHTDEDSHIEDHSPDDEHSHHHSDSFDENQKLIYLARIQFNSNLNNNSNIELGYSYLTGFNDTDGMYKTNINGVDITYRLESEKDYRALMIRGEYLWNKRFMHDGNIGAKGYYLFGQYRINKDWYLGGRYDYSEHIEDNSLNQKSYSTILTYYPTEFCYYRLQYKNILSNFEPAKNQLIFQINFLLGTHDDSQHDDQHDF